MRDRVIFHICSRSDWQAARSAGRYPGSAQDRADGFIHFSARDQIEESAARHHAGREGLVLLRVDAARLGDALRWEASRGGRLFPHLYGALPVEAVVAVDDLPLSESGRHLFPSLD